MKHTEILGVPVHQVTKKQAIERIMQFMKQEGCHKVYTPNPEIIMAARRDPELKKALKEADLVVPDGIGVVIASKFTKNKLSERVPGYDLVQKLFRGMEKKQGTVYFLGSAPGVAHKAADKMQEKYPGLRILGVRNGYFNKEEEKKIVRQINDAKPDLLLVGLGAPKQEKWVHKYYKDLQVKVCIGVGGSFDVMSGKVKRAPILFQKIGLEWFYRLIIQPTRWKRMLQLPLFMYIVIQEAIKNRK